MLSSSLSALTSFSLLEILLCRSLFSSDVSIVRHGLFLDTESAKKCAQSGCGLFLGFLLVLCIFLLFLLLSSLLCWVSRSCCWYCYYRGLFNCFVYIYSLEAGNQGVNIDEAIEKASVVAVP